MTDGFNMQDVRFNVYFQIPACVYVVDKNKIKVYRNFYNLGFLTFKLSPSPNYNDNDDGSNDNSKLIKSI